MTIDEIDQVFSSITILALAEFPIKTLNLNDVFNAYSALKDGKANDEQKYIMFFLVSWWKKMNNEEYDFFIDDDDIGIKDFDRDFFQRCPFCKGEIQCEYVSDATYGEPPDYHIVYYCDLCGWDSDIFSDDL